MRIIILSYFLFTLGCGFAQPSDTAQKAFSAKYPQAKEVKWSIDRNGFHEAEFTLNGEKLRADFTKNGEWVETESSVKWDDLPDAVKAAFKTEDEKKDIVEIEMVDSNKKGKFYDIEYKKGSGKMDISIRHDGTIIGKDNH